MSDLSRQQRIWAAAKQETTQPQATPPVDSSFRRVPCIVRSVDIPNFKMKAQFVRYQDKPPQKDRFERYGEEFDGYPLEGLDISVYSGKVVSGEFATGAPLCFAYRRGGVWIIEPVGASSSADRCVVMVAQTSDPIKSIYVARLKYDANGDIVPAALNADNTPKLSQVQCWDNTDSLYWSFFRSATPFGSVAPYVLNSATAVIPLLVIDGVECVVPVFDDALEAPVTSATQGDCP